MKSLTELLDGQADEVRLEDALFLALTPSNQLVDSDHLNSVSWLDRVDQCILKDYGD